MISAKFKAKFFFTDSEVLKHSERVHRRALGRMGSFIRTTARQSIRRHKQAKLGDMTSAERQKFHIQLALFKAGKLKKRDGTPQKRPKKKLLASMPGEPPRSTTRILPNSIFFGYDKSTMSMFVGPIRLGTGTVHILEYGGSRSIGSKKIFVQPRPFMAPAYRKELPKWPSMLREAANT